MTSEPLSFIDGLDRATAKELAYLGKVPAWTCTADSRFSYHLYIPENYHSLETLDLVVLVHGSGREAQTLRDEFASFAEEHSCVVLAPLFPIGYGDPFDTSNYKLVNYRDIRYDHVLLSMVDEVKSRYTKTQSQKFFLYGFSGGGQFVHRFAFLHPKRLHALVCGAPGSHTEIDHTRNYPQGVKDFESIFGQPVQWTDLKSVPTMFIVGDADVDTSYINARGGVLDEDSKHGRYVAIQRWEKRWRQSGGISCLCVVSGAEHEEAKMWPDVWAFLKTRLAISRSSAPSSQASQTQVPTMPSYQYSDSNGQNGFTLALSQETEAPSVKV